MRRVIVGHAARYPDWAVDDLYKLLYQAAMGSDHAAAGENDARERLIYELARVGAGPHEPLLDPITSDGHLVRVHLRPLIAGRLDPEPLLRAFLETARRWNPSPSRLARYGGMAARLGGEGLLDLPQQGITRYMAAMRAAGYPAVHHSPAFVALYRPAYRVVLRELLPPEYQAP